MKNGPIIFMTGATSGLGKVSALKAASKGATLIALVRDKEKGKSLVKELTNQFPQSLGSIQLVEGNLNSFESVVKACEEVKKNHPVLDMIVNNAGIMNFSYKETIDGIEETLQVNLLAPVLISHLLFDNLKKGEDPKIIFTSSGLHQGVINFENIEFKNDFSSFKVYRQSKLGGILLGRLLSKPLSKEGVSIYTQHPGMVQTDLGRDAGIIAKMIFYFMGKSPEVGSRTLTYLMETPNVELTSGEYYAKKVVTKITPESYDMEMATKLQERVEEYLQKYVQTKSPIL